MKRLIILVLAMFAVASSVSARLGDTGDQIEDSYGTIVQRRLRDNGTVTVVYKKDRFLFFVTFADGRSISESYSHVKGTDLSQGEIRKFLKANAAGATWTPENTGAGAAVQTQRWQGRGFVHNCEWSAGVDGA